LFATMAIGMAFAATAPLHAQGGATPPPDALRQLLEEASLRNRLPADLVAYRARVETEISILLRREEGNEAVAGIEQVASELRWGRTGLYHQRVVGYRTQQVGANFSMLTVLQTGWLNPVLYGNRLRVGSRGGTRGDSADAPVGSVAPRRRPAASQRPGDSLFAVHPLAAERERYYRYGGGDTVVVLQAGDRRIPIVQVRVQPRTDLPQRTVLFDGEMALDATRGALVRLRGHFVEAGGRRRPFNGALADALAFIEYEQGERFGRYWLPARQRVELQAMSPLLGDGRAVVRIVSRFLDMAVNDTTLSEAQLAVADSLRLLARRRLSYAPSDSLARFTGWQLGIGTLSQGMHADDFHDIGPDRWRSTGPPRWDVTVPRPADVMHFNRVEGLFTGVGTRLSLRDVAPGVVVRANVGYAWAEQTVRGRASVERRRGPWSVELRAARSLDITNDFRQPLDSGSSASAAFASIDAYDYVDRTSGTVALVHRLRGRTLITRAELGYADDRYRPAAYARGPFGGPPFRENRGVDEGGYVRSALLLEWKPDVGAEFVRPGLGGRLSYERGDGTLQWQRVEARLAARKPMGPFVATARGDAGVVLGDAPPPQQLFELGERQNLPGYADKAFAGTRAAVLRGQLLYLAPLWQQPIRLGRNLFLPGLSPGFSVGVQSGWTDAPTAGGLAAIRRLGMARDSLGVETPVSVVSERIRASVATGFRFFGGALFVGATRLVDQAAAWKGLVAFGQPW
jgi:hypothetical protein